MSLDLETAANERGIKYFLVSYTDLFGTQRAKLVPEFFRLLDVNRLNRAQRSVLLIA